MKSLRPRNIVTKVTEKKDGSIVVVDRLTKEKAVYKPLKGDAKRFINRKAINGKNRSNYLVENWSYKTLEVIRLPRFDLTIPKGSIFIWSGIRNRYEWKSEDGILQGMSKEQMEADKRFKKVRLPKKLKDQVEWSPAPPTSKELQEMSTYAGIAAAKAHRAIMLEQNKYDTSIQNKPLSVLPENHSGTELQRSGSQRVHKKSRIQTNRKVSARRVPKKKAS